MRHPDFDLMMLAERRRDDLALAARHRLVQEATVGNTAGFIKPLTFRETAVLSIARMLSGLGERLLTWSCRLETRVRLLTEPAADTQPEPCS